MYKMYDYVKVCSMSGPLDSSKCIIMYIASHKIFIYNSLKYFS